MEPIENLSVRLSLDANSFNGSISQVDRNLRSMSSELKAIRARGDEYGNSLEGLKSKQDVLGRSLEASKIKLQETRKKYDEMVASGKANEAQLERQAKKVNDALAAYNRLEAELNSVEDALKRQSSSWQQVSDKIGPIGDKLTAVGDKMKGIGQTMSASVTAPLIGLGTLAGKVAVDFDAAAGVIQTELGATGAEAEKLRKTATELWKQGFGDSVESVAVKVAGVTRALGDLNKTDLSNVTQGLDIFEKRGWADQQEALRAIKVLMESFGMSASQAMDYLTKGFQENLNYSGEFLDSVSEYSTYFAEFGLTADDMFAKFKSGAESGAFQLDKVGDAMKEFSLRAKDGSKTSTEAFEALGLNAAEMTAAFNKGGDTAKKAFETVVKALQNVEDETVRNEVAVGLWGTTYEDLGEAAFDAMLQASKGIEGVEGATKKASDALQNNLGAKAQKVWRDFLTDLEPVGQTLVDIAEDVLPKAANIVGKVTDSFADMSPEAKNAALAIAGVAAAIGPLLAIGGSLMAGIGGAITTVSALTGSIAGAGGLTAALGVLTGPVGWTVAAIAGLTAGFIALDNAMNEPVIKSDIFKGKISEATQEAVGAYIKLDDEATAELNSLAWSSQSITDTMANNMVTKYQQMGDQILQAMIQNHEAQLQEQQRLFAESDILTEQEEAKRLAKLKADQLAEIEAHNEQQARIKEIWTKAAEEKRGITEAEAAEIAEIQKQMRTKAVEELSASQQEQETILKNLKENKAIIEAETAANTVKKSMETRDKVVKEAEQQFAETVSYAEQGRDELGTITAEEAEAIIAEAERKKNEVISKAQDMHYDVVAEAQAQAGEHAAEVNWETGEVLSGWDSMYNGVISAVNWIRELFGKEPLAKKGTVKETGRQVQRRQNAELKPTKSYADGTPASGHPGGPAIVGEEGVELAHIPGEGLTLLGANGPQLLANLPKGSSVLPNKQTEKLLKSFGFPAYAEGIGDYFDKFLAGADAVWGMMREKFSLSDSLIPDWLNKHTGSPIEFIGKLAKDWIQNLMGDLFAFGGGGPVPNISGGAAAWRSMIIAAATQMGETLTDAEINGIIAQIQRESGGNQSITQSSAVWDINMANGNPARGLLQYIPQTFSRYAVPGHTNIYNGYDQLLAFFNNKNWRRDLPYGTRGWGPTGGRKYEQGGIIDEEQVALVGEGNKKEAIIPLEQYTERAKALWTAVGSELGMFKKAKTDDLTPATSGGNNEDFLKLSEWQLKSMNEIFKTAYEDRLDNLTKWIAKQKELETISAMDEIQILEYASKNMEFSGEEQQRILISLRDAKEKIYKEMLTASQSFASQSKTISEQALAEEKRLVQEYFDALASRKNAIFGFAGLFDEVKIESEITGKQLIGNLESQVAALDEWVENINELGQRNLDVTLFETLREMGPRALAEIKALNALTDEELSKYSELWEEKNKLARDQATLELEGLKKETETKIDELHLNTDKQLEALKKDWARKMKDITGGTIDEFDNLSTIMPEMGKNIIDGLITGLNNRTGYLSEALKSIADVVKITLKSEFEIQSPSKWMESEIGENQGLGWIRGIDNMKSKMLSATKRMVSWMTPNIPSMPQLATDFGQVNASSFVNNTNIPKNTGDTIIHVSMNIDAKDIDSIQKVIRVMERLPQAIRSR